MFLRNLFPMSVPGSLLAVGQESMAVVVVPCRKFLLFHLTECTELKRFALRKQTTTLVISVGLFFFFNLTPYHISLCNTFSGSVRRLPLGLSVVSARWLGYRHAFFVSLRACWRCRLLHVRFLAFLPCMLQPRRLRAFFREHCRLLFVFLHTPVSV